MIYDVFNGDADGIFALHQHRLCFPVQRQQLITGVKRDIELLSRIDGKHLEITVFDISFDTNRSALTRLLEKQNRITWFDHHYSGDIFHHPLLHTTINTSSQCCTSLIVNKELKDRFWSWAVCGAFGDNLHNIAHKLASKMHLSEKETVKLAELGELFNYNAYGACLNDLHFHPAVLYQAVRPFENPFNFIAESEELQNLRLGYKNDLALAEDTAVLQKAGKNRLYFFPDAAWARRISGVFSNMKAWEQKEAAHAIITEKDGNFRISVRAPITSPSNADTLCKMFPTGGGRAGAAGINSLPKDEISQFCEAFSTTYPS